MEVILDKMSIWDLTDEDRKSMGVAGYSEKALDLFNDREHLGELEAPSVCLTVDTLQGERLRFCLKVNEGEIVDVSYSYRGCPALSATAAATVKVVIHKTIDEANTITENDVWQVLDSLPPDHEDHIEFSIKTMKEALKTFANQKRLTPEEHSVYEHFCGLTGKEVDEMEIVPCSNCSLVQNCENDHVLI